MNVLPIYLMPFSTVFLIFIIFSFVGWVSEVLYVGIFFEHKFVNRGFLHGPICPIYGFGGLSILLLPQSLYTTWIPLFFASMIFGSAVEYLSSWILEKLFHTRWWDYSHYKLNIKGRICLLNSLLFGVLGVVIIHFVQPFVMKFLSLFSDVVLNVSADIIAVGLTVDLLITIRRLVDFSVSMARIKAFGENLREHYGHEQWFKGESFSQIIASVKAHAAERKDEVSTAILAKIEQFQPKLRNVESFMHRFPTLKSLNYKEELEMLREKIRTIKSLNKRK
ncbi:MAG: putative ABC transporter permease [Treponema sp.]|nr:putative ABC transporter permease [Treponema sp.]